jgi:hypothetical protein
LYFQSLSNEEKFVLADIAACKLEKAMGRQMSPDEYESFVWDYIWELSRPKYHQENNPPQ